MTHCSNCGSVVDSAAPQCGRCDALFEGPLAVDRIPDPTDFHVEIEACGNLNLPVKPPISVRYAVALACMTYGSSLLIPSILFKNHVPLLGYEVLLAGWWGVLEGNFAWYANPLFALAALKLMRGNTIGPTIYSFLGVALALTSPHAKQWWFSEAAGTPIAGLGSGYRVWLLSLTILLCASVLNAVLWRIKNNSWLRN